MNSRARVVVLLFVLIGSFIFLAFDRSKENANNTNELVNVNTQVEELEQSIKSDDSLDNSSENNAESINDIEIVKDYAQENSFSKKENDKIKNTVQDFMIAYCSVSEDIDPKTRLKSVKSLLKPSLYEELNKVIEIETDLATEYYVYRNINKMIIHSVSKKDDKINVGVVVYSDYLNIDLSTQTEDAAQDYILTLTKENGNLIIDSCVENFK